MEPDLIIDVGVHKGEDTDFYLRKGFRVVGVEANLDLCKTLTRQFSKYLDHGRLRLLNVAVAPEDGPVTFFQNQSVTDWGTTSKEWRARNERKGTQSTETIVEGKRFESILAEFGVPYYLKIDIEGADLLCVEALEQFSERPRYVSLESTMTSWRGLLEEFAILRRLGYRRFKVVNQLRVPLQTCPKLSREGRYVAQTFVHGSSGTFGDEAPGEWLSEKQAILKYRRIFVEYRVFGNDGVFDHFNWERRFIWRLKQFLPQRVWYDTHAAL